MPEQNRGYPPLANLPTGIQLPPPQPQPVLPYSVLMELSRRLHDMQPRQKMIIDTPTYAVGIRG
jgi:hypothetical protein